MVCYGTTKYRYIDREIDIYSSFIDRPSSVTVDRAASSGIFYPELSSSAVGVRSYGSKQNNCDNRITGDITATFSGVT